MKARIFFLSFAVLIATALIGCSEEMLRPEETNDDAPTLPPVESMRFDFSFFEGSEAFSQNPNAPQGTDESMARLNWFNAAVRVAFINLVVVDMFGPPALAFHAALSTDPIVEEDGTFLWTYVWKDQDGNEVTIDLRGRIDGVTVDWSLRVTDEHADPPLDEFRWFYGESNFVANTGYWIFNDLEDETEIEVARINWDLEDEEDRELIFEDTNPASDDYGDRLTYTVVGTIFSVQLYDASEDQNADITWDMETGVGSLMVPDYNHGERACWDENQEDIDCPDES